MHICMCLHEFMYTTYVQVLMSLEGTDPLELEQQVVVSHLI